MDLENKQRCKIFSITQSLMKHTGLTNWRRNSNLWKSPRTCSVNQKETREERNKQSKKCMQYITIRIVKRIGTTTICKETSHIKISISMYWIKTVEGQDVRVYNSDWFATAIHRVCQTRENTPTITCYL